MCAHLIFWGEIPGAVASWQKVLGARWSGTPQLPAGVCLSPTPTGVQPKAGAVCWTLAPSAFHLAEQS